VPTNILRTTFNSSTGYTIAWTAPADNGGSPATLDYEVWTDAGLGAGYSKVASTTSKTTSYDATGLTTGSTYFWKIKAFTEAGTSALSTGVGFLVGSVPSAPQTLAIVTQSKISIKVSWTAPASDGGVPLTLYTVYWDNATGTTFTSLGTTSTSTLTYTKSSGLTAGLTYKFKVTAKNSIGESAFSSTLSVIAASVPSAPSGLNVISQSPTTIEIGWTAPDNGGNAITDYTVKYNQGSLINTWVVLAASTSGLTQQTLSGITTPGETFQLTVVAINQIGQSTESSIFSVIAATIPDAPTNLTRNQASTSKTQVAFTWTAGPSNGGSVVIDHNIYWDQGTGTFVLASTDVTSLFYIHTTGISAGNNYQFKVQARNAVGASVDSSILTITAATVPGAPSAPTTTITGDEEYMVVDWSVPSDNGGLAILGYRVTVQAQDLSWQSDLVNCDASTDSNIISAAACQIPTDVLRASPFSLLTGTSLNAKVIAFNTIGDSTSSISGNGSIMPIVPTVPSVPLSLTRNNAITDQTQVSFTWSTPANNGRRPIIDYSI